MGAVKIRADGYQGRSILESLIHPMTIDRFIDEYWEKRP
jgi:hypothetical protein